MFKRPLKVEVDAQHVDVEHSINLNYNTVLGASRLIAQSRKSAIAVIVVAAVAKTSSEIAIHIIKTQIK